MIEYIQSPFSRYKNVYQWGGVPGRGSGVMSELQDYRTFSCSIQLSMKFKLLINIEIFKINKIWITNLRCYVMMYHPDVLKLIFKRSGKNLVVAACFT